MSHAQQANKRHSCVVSFKFYSRVPALNSYPDSLSQGLWPGSNDMKYSLSLSRWVWTLLYYRIGKPTRTACLWKSSAYIVTLKRGAFSSACGRCEGYSNSIKRPGDRSVHPWRSTMTVSTELHERSWKGKWGQERMPLLRMLGLTRVCPALLDVVKFDLLAFSQVHTCVC